MDHTPSSHVSLYDARETQQLSLPSRLSLARSALSSTRIADGPSHSRCSRTREPRRVLSAAVSTAPRHQGPFLLCSAHPHSLCASAPTHRFAGWGDAVLRRCGRPIRLHPVRRIERMGGRRRCLRLRRRVRGGGQAVHGRRGIPGALNPSRSRRRFAHRSGCVGAMLLHDDVRDVRDALFPPG